MERFESFKMLLSKQTGWATFVQPHPSVEIIELFKKTIVTESPHLKEWKKLVTCANPVELPQRIEWIFGF